MSASLAITVGFSMVVFNIYMLTLYPSVGAGDSGELVGVACTGGVAHPPGYPLWSMAARLVLGLARVVSASPEPAWWLNALCALLSAISAGLLQSTVARLGVLIGMVLLGKGKDGGLTSTADGQQGQTSSKPNTKPKRENKAKKMHESNAAHSKTLSMVQSVSEWGGVLAGGVFAFSPDTWSVSIQAEVFALNNFLVTLVVRLLVDYSVEAHRLKQRGGVADPRKLTRLACWVALACGLALSNQHTSVIYVLIIAPYVMAIGFPWLWRPTALLLLSFAALAGLAPYLYLPIAAAQQPQDSWGDQRTLKGFLTHFLRSEYGTFKLANDLGEEQDVAKITRRLKSFALRYLATAGGSWGAWLTCLGGGLLTLPGRQAGGTCVISCLVVYAVFINSLANLGFSALHENITARMWQQAYLLGYLCLGVGAAGIGTSVVWVAGYLSGDGGGRRNGLRGVVAVACSGLAIAVAAEQCRRHYEEMDNHDNYTFRVFGEEMVGNLPPNSILLLNDDINCNAAHYYTRCLGGRPDVHVIYQPLITYKWWVPMQSHHFTHYLPPNSTSSGTVASGHLQLDPSRSVIFPGKYHHPFERELGSFNMADFLFANLRHRPVFIAGGYKAGDDSSKPFIHVCSRGKGWWKVTKT